MTTDLEPPRVPPMTTAERSRMRNQLMDRTRPSAPRPARRWIAPLVGVGAVAAVVAGTLVVTDQPSGDPAISGGSAPTPAQLSGSPEAKVGVDLGAVPPGDRSKLLGQCRFSNETSAPQLEWSRKVRGIIGNSTMLIGVALNAKASAPASARLGYRYCLIRVPAPGKIGAVGLVGRIEDKAWRTRPTSGGALVAIGGSHTNATADRETLQVWTVYHALPTVATVEARYVVKGTPGPWTRGVVDGGFAYTEVQAQGKLRFGQDLRTEVRAFDAQGHRLPVG